MSRWPMFRFCVAGFALAASVVTAADAPRVTGDYVEARTAEVFAGGCVMNSEAETAGRQAVLAWRVARGSLGGATLDGLAIAAAVAADRNLGMREMGGEPPERLRAVVTLDDRASAVQRAALLALARDLAGDLLAHIVRIDAAPIVFTTTAAAIEVAVAGDLHLAATKEMTHDPSCGAMQWFTPFSARLTWSAMGVASTHAYSGNALGSKWSAPNKRSVFWGTFAY